MKEEIPFSITEKNEYLLHLQNEDLKSIISKNDGSNTTESPKKKAPRVQIQCKLTFNENGQGGCQDDVIFVKECKPGVVKFEFKIGETPDIPICVNGIMCKF